MSLLYLSRDNIVVCDDHKNLVVLDRREPLDVFTIEQRALDPGCMICATPPEPGRLCALQTCEKPLHPQWPGCYCSFECAYRDAL